LDGRSRNFCCLLPQPDLCSHRRRESYAPNMGVRATGLCHDFGAVALAGDLWRNFAWLAKTHSREPTSWLCRRHFVRYLLVAPTHPALDVEGRLGSLDPRASGNLAVDTLPVCVHSVWMGKLSTRRIAHDEATRSGTQAACLIPSPAPYKPIRLRYSQVPSGSREFSRPRRRTRDRDVRRLPGHVSRFARSVGRRRNLPLRRPYPYPPADPAR
jgi:hypothetical protein